MQICAYMYLGTNYNVSVVMMSDGHVNMTHSRMAVGRFIEIDVVIKVMLHKHSWIIEMMCSVHCTVD